MSAPLEGIRILDMTRLLPGPYCTMYLADLGAEVVKVEDTGQGDYIRWTPPYLGKYSSRFLALNRNKKSMTLNLKDPRGVEIFLKLIEKYDMVVEGFRPGVLDRLGVGYEKAREINPKIIYCALTGYGQDGPYSMRAGHDINYIGYTGVLSLNAPRGKKPEVPGTQIGDLSGAMTAVIGVLAALMGREESGKGQFVDVALAASAFSMLPMIFGSLEAGGPPPRAGETNLTGGQACYNTYETSDGKYICLGAIEPKFYQKFCSLVGREDLLPLHFSMGKDRDKLESELNALFKTKTKKEWCDLLENEEVCFGPVNYPEDAMEDPQVKHRGMMVDVPLEDGSKMRQVALPYKLSRTPPSAPTTPPGMGEHTEEILSEIGITGDGVRELRDGKVIK